MRENTAVTAHEPRVLVPEQCFESCQTLRRRAAEAALNALQVPREQMIVVCEKAGKLACHALVLPEGHYATFGEGVKDSDECFLANPGIFEKGGTVDDFIKRAEAQGATDHNFKELGAL